MKQSAGVSFPGEKGNKQNKGGESNNDNSSRDNQQNAAYPVDTPPHNGKPQIDDPLWIADNNEAQGEPPGGSVAMESLRWPHTTQIARDTKVPSQDNRQHRGSVNIPKTAPPRHPTCHIIGDR